MKVRNFEPSKAQVGLLIRNSLHLSHRNRCLRSCRNQTPGKVPYASLDEQTARDTLEAYDEFVRTTLDTSFAQADREGLKFDGKGNVTLPESLKKELTAVYEAGWDRLPMPESLGGVGAPPTISYAQFELTSGANPPIGYYMFGQVIARTIERLGTEAQKKRFAKSIVEKAWGGTMVLAEGRLASATGEDKFFYAGKRAAARWYTQNVLPGLTLIRKLVEAGTLELLDLPEEAF